MNKKGTALTIVLVYLMSVTVLCAAILAFSSQHYKLMSQRVLRAEGISVADGGLYKGIVDGKRGSIDIDSRVVDISVANVGGSDYLESTSTY